VQVRKTSGSKLVRTDSPNGNATWQPRHTDDSVLPQWLQHFIQANTNTSSLLDLPIETFRWWYNTGGAVLGVGHWNAGYVRNFPLLPFGVPIAPTVLRVGGPTDPEFGMVVDLSSILDNFIFVFR